MAKKEKEKKNHAIVKHSNQLAEVPFQGFTAREIDFFYAICYKVQNQGTNKVWISFDEFRSLIGYTRRGDESLIDDLKEMSTKFSKINLMEKKKSGFKIIVPFIDFEADSESSKFTVGVHPEFVQALNELDGTPGRRYTLADVIGISRMKSTYSKQCLRMLYLYRNAGYWYTTMDEFRYYLDIPKTYTIGDISRRVVQRIEKEFGESGIFEEFEIIPRKDDTQRTSGRRSVVGYTFSFKFSDDMMGDKSKDTDNKICPSCGKPLVKIKKKDGTGYFYGHKNGWNETAKCRFTISSEEEPTKKKLSDDEVSIGELNDYYREIRETEILKAADRKEEIRNNEPEIWNLYETREQKRADSIKQMGRFTFSEESREAQQLLKEEIAEDTKNLEVALLQKGYDRDFLEIRFRCPLCRDTGQKDDGAFCSCRKERADEIISRKTEA